MFYINTACGRIPPYTVTMFSAFILGIGLLYLCNRKDGIPKQIAGFLVLLSPVMILSCAAGLTWLSSGGSSFGFSSLGALFGMYLSAAVMGVIRGKRDALFIMPENCTFVLPLMYGVSKLGCFLAGCCRGIPYSGICSVIYTADGTVQEPVFPVQLAESALFLLIFAAGMLLRRRHRREAVRSVFLFSAAAKGLLDFLRAEHRGKLLSLNQILCLALIAAGLLLIRIQKGNGAWRKDSAQSV